MPKLKDRRPLTEYKVPLNPDDVLYLRRIAVERTAAAPPKVVTWCAVLRDLIRAARQVAA